VSDVLEIDTSDAEEWPADAEEWPRDLVVRDINSDAGAVYSRALTTGDCDGDGVPPHYLVVAQPDGGQELVYELHHEVRDDE
jgi:hypothetical protein